jgi:hypothetical protein
MPLRTDGSSPADAAARVRIDWGDELDRWRYTCPQGHRDWEPTNSHAWCAACAQAIGHNPDADPEFYELLDQRTGETVPWSRVIIEG